MAFLDEIIKEKHREIREAKRRHKIGDLIRMCKDAPPVQDFASALRGDFGLIAEVKRKSPSAGDMREENVNDAAKAYDQSSTVKAISVLTDGSFFGMKIDDLLKIKLSVKKPVLRKDFIVKEYQIYEARAYGADAVLLMANVLETKEDMRRMYDIVQELGMEAIFEAHTKEEIELIPSNASIYGLNSRKFMAVRRWKFAQWINKYWPSAKAPDPSIDSDIFNLVRFLPEGTIKVAESGVKPNRSLVKVKELGFNAVLVGTALLKDPRGIRASLSYFESIIDSRKENTLLVPSAVHSAA
jgi:indole-3-glycerol phosphate synthase